MKVCLVTGGSRGIGKEIAETFYKNGYTIISTYNNTCVSNSEIEYLKCDVKNYDECEKTVEYIIKKYGKIDVLVNNAGVSLVSLVQSTTSAQYDEIFDTNMKGVFNFVKLCTPYMIQKHFGRIINISSVWGNVGASCETVYSASKGAVNAFTKSLAKELGPSGITVNAICPGVIKTDMLNMYSEEDLEELKNSTPLLKLGKPDDIAKTTLFVADADFMTGQIITVDGGFTL